MLTKYNIILTRSYSSSAILSVVSAIMSDNRINGLFVSLDYVTYPSSVEIVLAQSYSDNREPTLVQNSYTIHDHYKQRIKGLAWNLGGVYTKTFSVKNRYFIFVYMEAMRRLHQYISTKNVYVIVIINEYPREINVTAIPRARSRDAFSDIRFKWVAANKKKQFVWTDDEAQLLLEVTHRYKIEHLVEGTRDYRQT